MQLFNYENAELVLNQLREGLNYPYIHCYSSTLGGKENISILLTISEDKKETWSYNILENSRYRKIHILNNGEVENFSKRNSLKKMRKFTGKSIEHIIDKINKLKEGANS